MTGTDEARGGYFDAATAAPLHPVARQALLAAIDDGWADPGRLYAAGRRAAQLHEAARAAVAQVIGCHADEIVFCGSGTEAARRAVLGTAVPHDRPAAVVHSTVEHSAVLGAVRAWTGTGRGPALPVPVDRLGRVDEQALAAAGAATEVGLVALMSANHEVGTVQPVAFAAERCAAAGVPLYVDAAQSVGRVPVPAGWSLLTASARKWGGPAGVGVLAVRRGTPWEPPQQPAAPVNLPAVVATAASLRAVAAAAATETPRLSALVSRIRRTVAATVPDVEIMGDPDDRLPHIVTFSCLYVDGEALLHALDRRGFAVSSGSACTAQTLRPSHVLEAMGVLSHGNVRVSLHPGVTDADVDRFLAVLPGLVAELRAEAGVTGL